jgi:hypothetical protein
VVYITYGGGGTDGGGTGQPGTPYRPPVPTADFYIATASLPPAILGKQYNAPLAATGGTAPYAFSVISGALPPGLALSAQGVISGAPTALGAFNFTIKATDSSNPALITTGAFAIEVTGIPAIITSSLADATLGVAYNGELSAQGANPPFTFAVTSGALPPGLALADQGGISGIPTAQGGFQFIVTVTDSGNPPESSTAVYAITVSPAPVTDTVASADAALLLAGEDGAIYCIEEGQYHDDDVNGNPQGYFSQWTGVPAANPGLAVMQLGGVSISAKGSGQLNVTAVDDAGKVYSVTTPQRPFFFQSDANGNPVETKKDFVCRGAAHSERWGPSFDNGGVADAWFEIHNAILWQRKLFAARRG